MADIQENDRSLVAKQLETARVKLRATGATVLSPTPEWKELRKEILELRKKLDSASKA
jgi:predicted nuclease with TOPRIM domain